MRTIIRGILFIFCSWFLVLFPYHKSEALYVTIENIGSKPIVFVHMGFDIEPYQVYEIDFEIWSLINPHPTNYLLQIDWDNPIDVGETYTTPLIRELTDVNFKFTHFGVSGPNIGTSGTLSIYVTPDVTTHTEYNPDIDFGYTFSFHSGGIPVPVPVPSYSFGGFEPPCDSLNVAITVKKNKCIPLKTELFDADGYSITDTDIEFPPVLVLDSFSGAFEPIEITEVEGLPPAEATDGNQFEFIDGRWCYNLKIKDYYTAPGKYTFKMVTGNQEEYIIEPTGTVQIVVLK